MPTTRRKVRPDEADALVAAWRASTLELRDFCAQQSLHGRSLRYWVDRLNAPTQIRMLEVTVPGPSPASVLRLAVEDVTIDVPEGFSADTLARLLAVIRAC